MSDNEEIKEEKSNLVLHAKRELSLIEDKVAGGVYGTLLPDAVLELIKTFAYQGHSGNSARVCLSMFKHLGEYGLLSPLTGKEDEFVLVSQNPDLYQNVRCGKVFKQSDRFNGQAYTIEGRVFSCDAGKSWFLGCDSHVPITFPYTPKEPERIILPEADKTYTPKEQTYSSTSAHNCSCSGCDCKGDGSNGCKH